MIPDSFVHDYAIIGAGIAGASVAYQLAPNASVVLLERESQPGYHATGRSAAMFMESYGTPAIRALTRASRNFYESPPAGFSDAPLLTPRGVLYIASHEQRELMRRTLDELSANVSNVRCVGAAEAHARVPVLRLELLCGAIVEEDARDVDVHALHHGYLRGYKARGGQIVTNAELVNAERSSVGWALQLAGGQVIRARCVVNAAGAWADIVAGICGARGIGLEPRRRTAFTFAPPEGVVAHHWPTVIGVDESFYFKPDAGQLLGSPANADPVSPHDVVAEEFDVALGIYRIEAVTHLQIRRPASTWAGLRSFVTDGDLVVGWDDQREGFFWLAAQGGYGIQSAAATSELAAALLQERPVPDYLAEYGFEPGSVMPARLRR